MRAKFSMWLLQGPLDVLVLVLEWPCPGPKWSSSPFPGFTHVLSVDPKRLSLSLGLSRQASGKVRERLFPQGRKAATGSHACSQPLPSVWQQVTASLHTCPESALPPGASDPYPQSPGQG